MSTLGGVPKSFFFFLFQEIGYTHSNAEGNCIGKKRDSKPNPHWRAAAMASSPLLKENFVLSFLSFFSEGSTHRISLVALYIKELSEKKMKVFVCIRKCGGVQKREGRKSLFLSSSFCCCVRGRKARPYPTERKFI